MNNLIAFFQTVGAQVVAYYLCKWLEEQTIKPLAQIVGYYLCKWLDSLFFKGSKH